MILQALDDDRMPRIGTTPPMASEIAAHGPRGTRLLNVGSSCASHHGILCGRPALSLMLHVRRTDDRGTRAPRVPIGTAVGSGDFKATSDRGEANNVRGR